jgi:pyridoxine kinase
MPAVLSVQSWVACGNVGNCAALFPLQRLGFETWSLNTVAFSNHTGYGRWRGAAVPADQIAGLFEGIAELGVLPRCDAVLSGYLGEADVGPVLLDIVARVKQANAKALYCCDPVMGDIGPGWYVCAGIPEFYRDQALAAADIATPNRFELEWLSGSRIGTVHEAAAAAETLRRRGPGIILVTSLESAVDRLAVVAVGPEGAWAVETPRLPIEATGCGDAVAALFLGRLLQGSTVPEALAQTIASIWGVVEATIGQGGGELALVAAQDELVNPTRKIRPQKL